MASTPSALAEADLSPKVSPNDRLMFTTFLAGILHALIILGIGITLVEHRSAPPSLEITLASHKSEQAPEDADFLAQMNQQGSGTELDKKAPSTDQIAEFEDNKLTEVQPIQQQAVNTTKKPVVLKEITATRSQKKSILSANAQQDQADDFAPESQVSLLARSLEIASLEAELRDHRQAHAKRPRKRQLTAASTRESRDARYMDSWRSRIEAVGNLNYPSEARSKKIYGRLRLMVAVAADGSVDEIRILESSGHRILDDAAIRIVRLAEPFARFPDEIARDTDILEIIRTWDFGKDELFSSF